MDFFEEQARARTRTGWLVGLFALAVVLIVGTVYLAAVLALRGPATAQAGAALAWWDPGLLALTALGVGLIVGVASGVRTLSLRRGGPAVAEMLGGRHVLPNSADPDERRLLNVVEEMALAAGMPVPVVYVLPDEPGINAFAAGYGMDDAVVAVTDGALHALTRDELQGVVAHEFSHLLNRDSRLNIQLTGLIFGILALGLAGRLLLRSGVHVRGGKKNQGAAVVLAVGLALFVTGYLGVLFGRMIRAAVSRQREVLADASAVQFTRNPAGLAGALKKIGAAGSAIRDPKGEEVSHFFFASGLRPNALSRLWSTHPPLMERIKRLDPSFDGDFSRYEGATAARPADAPGVSNLAGEAAGPSPVPPPVPPPPRPVVGEAVAEEIPAALHDAVGTSFGAVATLYALMLDPDEPVRAQQVEALREELAAPLFAEVLRMIPAVGALPRGARLPLADVAAPALRQLSAPQAERFAAVIGRLARADGHLSIFEFALETIIQHRLAHVLDAAPVRHTASLAEVLDDAVVLLSALAHVGAPTMAEMQAAFRAGLAVLTRAERGPVASTAKDLDGVLDRIGAAQDAVRARVVEACVRTVLHDREVTRDEGHLLRAVAIALEAPLPPFLSALDAEALARAYRLSRSRRSLARVRLAITSWPPVRASL
jgi:Zn-dependent protease with chaperone function